MTHRTGQDDNHPVCNVCGRDADNFIDCEWWCWWCLENYLEDRDGTSSKD
jgi:hypothetical protein